MKLIVILNGKKYQISFQEEEDLLQFSKRLIKNKIKNLFILNKNKKKSNRGLKFKIFMFLKCCKIQIQNQKFNWKKKWIQVITLMNTKNKWIIHLIIQL